jgi:hypothetical protein
MLKKILWTLFVVIIVGPAPSAVRAQGPGMFNPGRGGPALPPGGGGVGANGGMKGAVGGPFLPPQCRACAIKESAETTKIHGT